MSLDCPDQPIPKLKHSAPCSFRHKMSSFGGFGESEGQVGFRQHVGNDFVARVLSDFDEVDSRGGNKAETDECQEDSQDENSSFRFEVHRNLLFHCFVLQDIYT